MQPCASMPQASSLPSMMGKRSVVLKQPGRLWQEASRAWKAGADWERAEGDPTRKRWHLARVRATHSRCGSPTKWEGRVTHVLRMMTSRSPPCMWWGGGWLA